MIRPYVLLLVLDVPYIALNCVEDTLPCSELYLKEESLWMRVSLDFDSEVRKEVWNQTLEDLRESERFS